MPRYDFHTKRLFVIHSISANVEIALDRGQSSYLINVLRMTPGAEVLIFNGIDGEWLANLVVNSLKSASLTPRQQTRPQPDPYSLAYLFAPLNQGRLDYMVQKAVEMGAGRLVPVITDYTQNAKINVDRMRVNAMEAAEQCGILSIPRCEEARKLDAVLDDWDNTRRIIFCDEGETSQNPLAALINIDDPPGGVLIGPEGGFSEKERELLRSLDFVTPIPLGPRVLRADTAAVAALAIVQAKIGDWK